MSPAPQPLAISAPIMIADNQSLADAAEHWQQCEALAIDTEFVRTDTFYANLGLIQISDGTDCWLVDPLPITDFSPLTTLMTSPAVMKVFHATSEDLEILEQTLGCVPAPLFDTQVAAALTGYGFSKGYAPLVGVLLGIELDKHETRSDWIKRPLTEAQKGYAAEDVYHLASLYTLLQQRLAELGRSDWMVEEMQVLLDKTAQPDNIEQHYLKVRAGWKLNPQGLALLQQLCLWREQEARQSNKPRSRIAADKILLEIALHKPCSHHELKEVADMHLRSRRIYGDKLLALVVEHSDIADENCPPPMDKPLPREVADTIKKLKSVVNKAAEQHDLPTEVLAKKRDIEDLVRSMREDNQINLPKNLAQGWRFKIVGQPLLELAKTL